jgi:hypothetical protein
VNACGCPIKALGHDDQQISAFLLIGVLLFLAFGPALAATRYGYTWSLLIWLVPVLVFEAIKIFLQRKRAL